MSHDRVRAFHFAGGLFDDVLRKSSGATNHATPDSSFGVSMLTTFIRSSDTVSYTHLDVYKRQAPFRAKQINN